MVGGVPDRHEPTDAGWAPLRSVPVRQRPRGEKVADHRTVINAIRFRVRAGMPRCDPPERTPPVIQGVARQPNTPCDPGNRARALHPPVVPQAGTSVGA
ncbi:hypothetical protein DSY14_12690 [Nocardiopsis sp. MG754419]|nr:hypothetical protein [Nocardiopsis sp. MG754419]